MFCGCCRFRFIVRVIYGTAVFIKSTIDNPNNKSKPTTAAEHFLSSPNHTANDMLLIPIEKIFSNRDSIRKAREAFLIQKGKTIDPDGLNIREETYQYCYLYHVISLFFHLILISCLHCQSSFLRISGFTKICNKRITFQYKIFIVPEEGWFGQPKYSTHIKTFLRCAGFCLYFLHCYCAYVPRILRYSGFPSMLNNTGIFLHGLKMSGKSRS